MPVATPKVKKAPKSPSAPAGPPPVEEREVQYPEVTVIVASEATGGVVTVDLAKEYLGWEEETDDVKFGPDFLFTDLTGRKVRCRNNTRNRPLDERWAYTIAQEHLRRRWRLNGEAIVVGKCGEVVSGQHRLVGLILAEQLRQADPEGYAANWSGEVTMDTIIVFGVDEQDDVVNTLDTGKSRSFADVLYRSELFAKYAPNDRKTYARASDYATRLLWTRTGAKEDAYAPTKTHAEGMAFLYAHPSLIDQCVKHVVTEENKGSITQFVPMGTAAGMCYLMAASNSDPVKYAKTREEKALNLKLLDRAQEFWVALSGGSNELKAVRDAVKSLADPDTGDGGTAAERQAILVKAWHRFAANESVTPASVKLRYVTSAEDGSRILDESPLLGGIDLGDGKSPAEVEPEGDDVTLQQVAEAAAKVRADKGETAPPVVNKDAGIMEQLTALRKSNPGHVLYFEVKDQFRLFDEDAHLAVKHLGVKLDAKETVGGVQTVSFKKSNLQPSHQAFNEASLRIATVVQVDGEPKVTRMAPIVKAKKK